MKLQDAKIMGELLISLHCPDYTFKFHTSRRIFGQCKRHSRELTFSRQMVFLNDVERVKRVILHEIAHALTPGHGHDSTWFEMCKTLGIPNETIYWDCTDTTPLPKKYLAQCPTCNKTIGTNRLRKRVRQWFCAKCSTPIQLYPNIDYILVQNRSKNSGR